jgi:uncharacterized protein (DUF952 family)
MIIKPINIDTNCIEYKILNEYTYEQDKIRTEISKKSIDLEEGFIRDALISLGWTPPANES